MVVLPSSVQALVRGAGSRSGVRRSPQSLAARLHDDPATVASSFRSSRIHLFWESHLSETAFQESVPSPLARPPSNIPFFICIFTARPLFGTSDVPFFRPRTLLKTPVVPFTTTTRTLFGTFAVLATRTLLGTPANVPFAART
jgi:hypothetical protein